MIHLVIKLLFIAIACPHKRILTATMICLLIIIANKFYQDLKIKFSMNLLNVKKVLNFLRMIKLIVII